MNKDRIIDPEKIHVVDIKTSKGSIDAATDVDTNAIAGHRFQFELGTGLTADEKVVGLNLQVNIEAVDIENNVLQIKGSYTHEIIFVIDNLEDFLELDEETEHKYRIDALLGSTIAGIAFSTVRGIIFTRTQGTSLGAVILPVINPQKLIGLETK